jgi:hypothetical protein
MIWKDMTWFRAESLCHNCDPALIVAIPDCNSSRGFSRWDRRINRRNNPWSLSGANDVSPSVKSSKMVENVFETRGCCDFARLDSLLDGCENFYFWETNTIREMNVMSLLSKAWRRSMIGIYRLKFMNKCSWNDVQRRESNKNLGRQFECGLESDSRRVFSISLNFFIFSQLFPIEKIKSARRNEPLMVVCGDFMPWMFSILDSG